MNRLTTSLIAVGVFATVILAAIVAFLGTTLYSTVDAHLGSGGVEVQADRADVERDGFFSELADVARANDVVVSVNYSSLAVSNGEYRVYSSSVFPEDGRVERPRFERGEVDVVYPLEEFPQPDPRQNIFLKGSSADQQEVLQWLEAQGLDVVTLTSRSVQIFTTSSIPVLLALSVLLCLVLGAGHVLSRSREIGVHRLMGLSLAGTIRIEIGRQWKALVGAYVGGPLIVAALLYAYNGWALGGVFWTIYFLVSLALTACLLLGYLGGQFLVRITSIPQAVKGRINARPIFYSLTVVRGVTLVAALSAVAALVGFAAELDERQSLQAAWEAHRGPQEFALNTNTAVDDWTNAETAAPFRAADEAGALLLVDPYWITWPVQLEAPVLLVNQEYARQSGVPTMDRTSVTVCSPVELSEDSKLVIEDSLNFEASNTDHPTPPIEWRAGCNLGTVFTYDVEFRPLVDDPILVILPPGLAPLGDHNVMSKVSQQVLISASPNVPSQLTRGSTGSTLSFVRPREDSWQHNIRAAEQNVILWGLNTLAAVLLVTVLVGAAIITFRVTYRRKIHIAYICGRSPWWVARPVVAIEIIFFVVTIGWLLYKVREHQIQADLQLPSTWNIGFEQQWSAWTIAAVVLFGAAWFAASVALTLRAASQWDARQGTEPQ